MRLRVLDLDGSVAGQPPFHAAIQSGDAQLIDLRAEGPALRLWGGNRAMDRLKQKLSGLEPPPGKGPDVTFYGSGDFHHLVWAMIAAASFQAVTVIHFDNHPDWVRWPPRWHCGSWVNRVLELPNVAKVITLGPCGHDLTNPRFKGANLKALEQGRLEIYPWRHEPSDLGRGRSIAWEQLEGCDWPAFLDRMIAALPTESVWITIDKDVLGRPDAVTNWDQGEMPLDHILLALRKLAAAKRLLGVDVCGEFAPPRFKGLLKTFSARLDQPRTKEQPDLSRNERSNARLLDCLREVTA